MSKTNSLRFSLVLERSATVGEVVKLVPADQEPEPDIETLKANFRRQLASLCFAAEWEEIPREFIYEHLRRVTSNVRKCLTPEGEAEFKRAMLEQK